MAPQQRLRRLGAAPALLDTLGLGRGSRPRAGPVVVA